MKFFGDLFAVGGITLDESIVDTDIAFVNLEIPITDSNSKIHKAGPNLKGNKDDFIALARQFTMGGGDGKMFCNLANNHIGDYGEVGILDTIKLLDSLGIYHCGVSKNNEIKPFIMGNIAIICFCEEQFGLSSFDRLGANYFTPQIYPIVTRLKNDGHKVIVASHIAEEMWLFPSPYLQNFFRSLIEMGVDIVWNSHSHIPQGYERYNDKLIIYGCGNFIVDENEWNENNTKWSYCYDYDFNQLVINELHIENNSIKFYPLQNMEYYKDCNEPLKDYKKLNALWQEYSVKIFDETYSKWLGYSTKTKFVCNNKIKLLIRALSNRDFGKYIKQDKSFDLEHSALIYHLFSCKSHRDAIKTALGVLCGENVDLRDDYSKIMLDRYYQS